MDLKCQQVTEVDYNLGICACWYLLIEAPDTDRAKEMA